MMFVFVFGVCGWFTLWCLGCLNSTFTLKLTSTVHYCKFVAVV